MRRRALAALSLPLVLALALAGLGTWWLRTGRLPAAGATWMTVTRTGGSDATPAPGAPVYVLVVGSDARLGETVARGDAIHVIGVNPSSGQATMLDIPRDTGAAIPGHGTDKINAAMSTGGPELLAQTVSNFVGVPISYVITTNFDGFMGMVDDLGGVLEGGEGVAIALAGPVGRRPVRPDRAEEVGVVGEAERGAGPTGALVRAAVAGEASVAGLADGYPSSAVVADVAVGRGEHEVLGWHHVVLQRGRHVIPVTGLVHPHVRVDRQVFVVQRGPAEGERLEWWGLGRILRGSVVRVDGIGDERAVACDAYVHHDRCGALHADRFLNHRQGFHLPTELGHAARRVQAFPVEVLDVGADVRRPRRDDHGDAVVCAHRR